jgi:Protein of unknown function (DUF2786)
MTDVKTSKMLERVRALLSKADSSEFPEEAESFRAKADEMMTLYAIEMWQVEQAQRGLDAKPEITKRDFDFSWWGHNSRSDELWELFLTVAYHCRCVVATRGYRYSEGMPAIGLPSDLDYFDMLFTHLMLDMARQLDPKPDPRKSFEENAYTLRAAGVQRVQTIKMLYELDQIPGTDPEAYTWEMIYKGRIGRHGYFREFPEYPKDKQLRAKVRKAAEKYAKEHGLDSTTTVNPGVWQRSFAMGFVREIDKRMGATAAKMESASTGDSMAVAVRDIRAQARSTYDEMFPPPEESKDKKVSRAVSRQVAFNAGAYHAGRDAGSKANLNANPNKGVGGSKGELTRG